MTTPNAPGAIAARTYDAYDADRPLMLRCACGQDHAPDAHAQASTHSETDLSHDFIEAAMVKALFPVERVRRGFLKALLLYTSYTSHERKRAILGGDTYIDNKDKQKKVTEKR